MKLTDAVSSEAGSMAVSPRKKRMTRTPLINVQTNDVQTHNDDSP
jgi:hypothetical protein